MAAAGQLLHLNRFATFGEAMTVCKDRGESFLCLFALLLSSSSFLLSLHLLFFLSLIFFYFACLTGFPELRRGECLKDIRSSDSPSCRHYFSQNEGELPSVSVEAFETITTLSNS